MTFHRLPGPWVAPALILALSSPAGAEEMEGRVTSVQGDEVFVSAPGDVRPKPGDRVVFGFRLEGVEELVQAGTGTVKEVRGDVIVVTLADGGAPIAEGYVARISVTPGDPPPPPTAGTRSEGGSAEGWVIVETPDIETCAEALNALSKLRFALAEWAERDPDGNGVPDHWTEDVAGLHYMTSADGRPLNLIPVDLARADRVGLATHTKEPAQPYHGYWFAVVQLDADGNRLLFEPDESAASGLSFPTVGYCAYPALHGDETRFTFLLGRGETHYWKDLGPKGAEVERWPGTDPTADGWTPFE